MPVLGGSGGGFPVVEPCADIWQTEGGELPTRAQSTPQKWIPSALEVALYLWSAHCFSAGVRAHAAPALSQVLPHSGVALLCKAHPGARGWGAKARPFFLTRDRPPSLRYVDTMYTPTDVGWTPTGAGWTPTVVRRAVQEGFG